MRKFAYKIFSLSLILLCFNAEGLVTPHFVNRPPRITPALALQQPWYGYAKPSPDGNKTVFVRKWAAKLKSHFEWRYQLWWQDGLNQAAVVIPKTQHNHVYDVSWFPDSNHIAFVADATGEGRFYGQGIS